MTSTDSTNPYKSPARAADTIASREPLVSIRSVLFVAAMAVAGGIVGLMMGALLGIYLPDYYRSVFANGDSPSFNPVAVGIGQGLTQGVVLGSVLAVALVVIHYWYRLRLSKMKLAAKVDPDRASGS